MSGFELGRKKKGNDKRERYKIRTVMGSREDSEGVYTTAASASHGECSTSPFKREYAGLARTIKAERHDLGVVEMNEKKLGNIYGFDGGNYAGNVYDDKGLSPTIRAYQGGNQQPMIVAMHGRYKDTTSDNATEQRLEQNSHGICNTLTSVQKDNMVLIKQASKEGYTECECGGVADLSFPSSRTRRGRVQENGRISPTITAEANGLCRIEDLYRIRKLTPLECWRLMSFSDNDFYKAEKVNSNSQLYKQAGNSIVKDVLVAIFGQMI